MLPGTDKSLVAESLDKIDRLAEGKLICPGHEVLENEIKS